MAKSSNSTKFGGRTISGAVLSLLVLTLMMASAPVYHVWSLSEKVAHTWQGVGGEEESIRPGDEWASEEQAVLDKNTLLAAPWVGRKWYVDGDEFGYLYLDTNKIREGEVCVDVIGLKDGPHEICLSSQGKHSYRGLTYCKHHGGQVSEEEAILIRLEDNRLRLIAPFNESRIDVIFKRGYIERATNTAGVVWGLILVILTSGIVWKCILAVRRGESFL